MTENKIEHEIEPKTKRKIFDKSTYRFIIVGIINTIVGTSVMFLLYNLLGCSYWVSSASNYIVGSIVSYILNKYYTFEYKKKSVKVLVKFIVNISVCYLVSYGVAKPIIRWVLVNLSTTWQDNIAMLCGMGIFVVLNYIGQRIFVFKKED